MNAHLSHQTGFVGSWRFEFRPADSTSINHLLGSLDGNGLAIVSPPAVEAFPLHPSGAIYVSSAHGAWQRSGEGSAEVTVEGQVSSSDGAMIGIGRVSTHLHTGPDDDTFQGTYEFMMENPEGQVVATEKGTVRGTRITVKPSSMVVTGHRDAASTWSA